MRALLMQVGPEWYAVDIDVVREVVAEPSVTVVPTAPNCLVGLFNVRGEILPLFDIAVLLDVGRVEQSPYATVVHTDLGAAGLVATAFPESVELEDPVDVDAVAGKGMYAVGSQVAVLVDIDDLLSPGRIARWRQ